MGAEFFIYDKLIQTPEISRKWAKFSIYEGLTKSLKFATEYV
jgi:hypothetical protein